MGLSYDALLSSLAELGFDGEKLRIRKRDDALLEEHRAYLLVKEIKDEQAKRATMKNKAKQQKSANKPTG